jgi:magnesium-protoporphyrin O-methyltransferase
MTQQGAYAVRRSELETYFDRTAADAWAQLTSTAPVSRIRATVRAGRDLMRETLLSWLPAQLNGATLLDAGCGTGALSGEAAARGAKVTGVDVSASLVALAQERCGPSDAITFHVGDMLDPAFGGFDHVVAMDSLIHYEPSDVIDALAKLAGRTARSILFTHAPRTPALTAMHVAGRLFPRADRAPAIVPIAQSDLARRISADLRLSAFSIGRTHRVTSGFYMSQAMELVRR